MRTQSIFAIAPVVFLALSCYTDPELSLNKMDNDLEAALISASDGNGLNYFVLPASNDLDNIPSDPKNPLTPEKIALGKLLYHETALATNPRMREYGSEGTYSCATCHHVAAGFQSGLRQGISEGGMGFGQEGESREINPKYIDWTDSLDVQPIRTPSTLNTAFQDVMLWNGQFGATGTNTGTNASWIEGTPKAVNKLGFEGLETQAIAGLSVHRQSINSKFLRAYPEYKTLFDKAFGTHNTNEQSLKELTGLAIAAYERTLLSTEAPFQKYLQGDLNAMTDQQKKGALLFFGKANCVGCHTGPALNSMKFHALGMNELKGIKTFNTEGEKVERLGRGGFTNNPVDNYKFKVPQLYNLADVNFLGHGGTFNSVKEVIEYKNQAIPQNPEVPAGQLAIEFRALNLTSKEIDQLTSFIEEALYDADLMRYVPATLPSGNFFPVNDETAQGDPGIMGGK